ncbi:Flp pilus assembly protein TadB [Paenibacillus sophorae]|uniref:Flp pilus assembly protein TadB n=1 Tax=Paenibacillus sophorae TaxID=1333845 RepID=A0A1H8UE06_9BACL|nr:hypothetical protein [Paenibacillus sophorae]QWU13168.1 hypothetical protein KP014_14180 [Paenibacillus sophorae]SEP01326.1 Flp pilus assembly protein TadB [Paenibacillus sophorae]
MMQLLLLSFIGLSAGCLLLLNLSPRVLTQELARLLAHLPARRQPLGKQIRAVQRPKKLKGWRATVQEARSILKQTGQSDKLGLLLVGSLTLALTGALLAILLGNLWLLPVLAGGFALLPFWAVLFTATFYKKRLHGELETALSVITTSYLRSENILAAVEENLPYLNPPVADVFHAFLAESKLIHANLRLALQQLQGRINDSVFREWCDALIACQEDRTLKSTLMPIVAKLSDMRVVSAELDYLLYEPLKEFLTMSLLMMGNIPLLYFLNRDWFHTLTTSAPGHIVLALCALTLFVSLAAVIRLTRPLEYKR